MVFIKKYRGRIATETSSYQNSIHKPQNPIGQKLRTQEEISLLFVVHNEEKIITSFVNEISKITNLQIVVAEDGSTDSTKKILSKLKNRLPMEIVTAKKKKGYMNATRDGLLSTKSKQVFITDSDGQFVPSDFAKLYKKRKNFDLTVGWKKNRSDAPWRIIIAKTFHVLVRAIFGLPIHDPNTAFRIVRKETLVDIANETKYLKYSFWTEFTIRAFRKGYSLTEIPIEHKNRVYGKSHIYSLKNFPEMLTSQLAGLFKLWKELRLANQ